MEQFFAGVADDLILNIRQSAWLTTERDRPEDDKVTKEITLVSRLEQQRIERKDPLYSPELPPVTTGEYMLDYLFQAGPVLNTGAGLVSLTNQELRYWARNKGIIDVITPWELDTLVTMSREYLAESRRARQIDCPEPWDRSHNQTRKPPMTAMQRRLRALAGV